MKKKTLLMLLLTFIVAVFTGSFLTTPAQAAKVVNDEVNPDGKKTYIVGLDDTFAPMGFRDGSGNLVGMDIDLAAEVAERLDYHFVFQPIDWQVKETELNSGNIDMIWNGYGITPEREAQVSFSEPYLTSQLIIVTSADNEEINSLEDLVGKKVTTQSGSTSINFMKEWPNDIYNRIGELVLYPSYNNAFLDLDAGRVDALVASELYGRYTIKQRGEEKYRYFPDDSGSAEEFMGVGFRKSDVELREEVNQALEDMRNDGTYAEIETKWLGGEETTSNGNNIFLEMVPSLKEGLKLTLGLFSIVLIASIPLGLLVGIMRTFGPKWLQFIIEIYIFVMRSTPLMLQLMLVFFGLPYIGISFDRFPAALIAFIVNYVAYLAEIFRGGFTSVDKGQYESIRVLGIGKFRGFTRIIIPQVFNIVLPSLGNEVIALVKDTSLVYVIGLGEILRVATINANTYASLVPFLIVGLIYMVIVAIITVVLRQVEKRITY